MIRGVHLNSLVALGSQHLDDDLDSPQLTNDSRGRSCCEYPFVLSIPTSSFLYMSSPCEEVPEPSKEAADSAIFAGRDRSPMVDSS